MWVLLIITSSFFTGVWSYPERAFNNKEDCEGVLAIYQKKDPSNSYICLQGPDQGK